MADWRTTLGEALAGKSAVLLLDEPLSRHTTFRIGGPADVWVEVGDESALAAVLGFCHNHRVDWHVLGRGSNVLVSDQGLRGVVVCLGLKSIEISGTEVRAGAGALLDEVAERTVEHGLTGAEFLAGIPGTVGGALRTNAGAFGHQLSDLLESLTVLDPAGERREMAKSELHTEYRKPVVRDRVVVTSVRLKLATGTPEPLSAIRAKRREKQPAEPSAGSFFKNPAGEPAGRLIERCGLKGRKVGGAQVSEKHANFLVNTGGARFGDVLELSQIVMAKVEEETGILLEPEVVMLPEDRR